jgi:hypothetical protein
VLRSGAQRREAAGKPLPLVGTARLSTDARGPGRVSRACSESSRLEESSRLAAREPGEEHGRHRRRPASAAPRVPERAGSPRHDPKEHDRGTVRVATLTTARPGDPPRAPAGEPQQGRAEAPRQPGAYGEQAEERNRSGDWGSRDWNVHATRFTRRLGYFLQARRPAKPRQRLGPGGSAGRAF